MFWRESYLPDILIKHPIPLHSYLYQIMKNLFLLPPPPPPPKKKVYYSIMFLQNEWEGNYKNSPYNKIILISPTFLRQLILKKLLDFLLSLYVIPLSTAIWLLKSVSQIHSALEEILHNSQYWLTCLLSSALDPKVISFILDDIHIWHIACSSFM